MDRLFIISHSGRRVLKSMRYRYLSKSILVSCKGDGKQYEYINYRGSHFSNSSFRKAVFKGCDFWGTTFKKCIFTEALFQDCVFQACRFKNCDFSGAIIQYSAIVNTNTEQCKDIITEKNTIILKKYPEVDVSKRLMKTLDFLKQNKDLRKTKVLWISDKKPNYLNLFLLLRKYTDSQIVSYLEQLTGKEAKLLTTYGSLNSRLNTYVKKGIISLSRPTQSRGLCCL